MSQVVGQNFRTRIPQFSDDASIEEALKVYHYGVDNYTVQPIPDNSIEGHFRSLDSRLNSVEAILSGGLTGFIRFVSQSSAPNIITGQTTLTVPLTVRAIPSQTSNLQQWQNSSGNNVAGINASGYFSTSNYIGVGSITPVSGIALNVNIVSSLNRGIVVRAANSQAGNLQEWQNSSGSAIAWISASGEFNAEKIDCGSP